MKRLKITISILLAAIFLAAQAIVVGAAPVAQEEVGIISGSVESIVVDLETSSVVVTLIQDGVTQEVSLSLNEAIISGFVVDDGTATGNYVANEELYGTIINFDPASVLVGEDEKEHPVGSALAGFFTEKLGVDYDTVMEYHDDGVGFGVIAQALWMTNALKGDSTTFSAILDAKQNKDFSGIQLPDGSEPQNWGQFRKAVMSDREKAKENLGAIMSGRADDNEPEESQELEEFQESQKKNGKSLENDKSNNGNPFESLDDDNQDKRNNGKAPNKDNKTNNGKGKDKNKNK